MTTEKTAFLFPGQGSQYPGIGKDLHQEYAVVRDTYSEASDVLGYDIARLSFDDPDGVINLTRYTQPVLLTHSIACHRVFTQLTEGSVAASMGVGHSLGEYSALVIANSLSFELALRLVKSRGELMGEFGEGQMEALMMDLESASELAGDHHCGVAACNLPEQIVVGGLPDDLDALAATMSEKYPRKRSARLKTEGAFHTFYMIEAAKRYRKVLEDTSFNSPGIDVFSNFSGGIHNADTASIRSRLYMQLFNPVLWHENLVGAARAGATMLLEFGGGIGKGETAAEKRPNLESIVKKTFRGADNPPEYHSVINLESLAQAVARFTD